MKLISFCPLLLLAVLVTHAVTAQLVTIEPDDFANATVLNHTFPQISLVTAGTDNVPFPFDVTASNDGFGYTSTGTRVFGHAGIPFWNSFRRMRMDFASPTSFLSIDFIGGWSFTNDIGRLDAFDQNGVLLASYTTAPLAAGSVETGSLTRPAGDIAWAVAYMPADGGDFGRLDHLQFLVVPEPTCFAVSLLGLASMWQIATRRK